MDSRQCCQEALLELRDLVKSETAEEVSMSSTEDMYDLLQRTAEDMDGASAPHSERR